MKYNKEKDNIISIVKSIRPINYLYSKQNKDYDKYFRSASVKGLIKQINTKQKFNEFYIPGESLEDVDNKKNTFMDVNFKSTFNYIEELSNLKNLPMVLVNKSYYKKSRYNNKLENKTNKKFNKKKLLDKEKKKKLEKKSQIKCIGDEENTLDPGRYHPNYDFIKKRYPCAYLGKPKIKKEDSFQKETKEIIEQEEIKENEKENTSSNSENENENENDTSNQNNTTNRNNLEDTSVNKSNQFNRNTNYKKSKKMNFSSPNFYVMQKGKQSSKNITKYVLKQSNKSKENNPAISCSNNLDLDKSQKIKEQLKIFNIKNQNKYKRNKKMNNKNSSMENLRCPIIFDRMPGRDRSLNHIDNDKDSCRSNYNPDYGIIRPHIPSTIFKCKRKFENYKKYITGKIIRSYCYSPDNYFVFEIKNNKDNILGKYGRILSKN